MPRRERDLTLVTEEHAASCVHHWRLAEPREGVIEGRCKQCGATKRFPGAPESTQRFDDYRELMSPPAPTERRSA